MQPWAGDKERKSEAMPMEKVIDLGTNLDTTVQVLTYCECVS